MNLRLIYGKILTALCRHHRNEPKDLLILPKVNEEQNLAKLQAELKELQLKRDAYQLSRDDITRILGLELQLNGTWDEFDNYEKFLSPDERFPKAGAKSHDDD
jgi:hypothetical protein